MTTKSEAIVSHHSSEDIRLRAYVIGFISSLVLTMVSYVLVVNQVFSRTVLIAFIMGLALAQFTLQLIYFLHLGNERKPRWKFLVFTFMVSIVLILVAGSIWIMDNLNYNMPSGDELLHHMKVDESL
jgi:cytochrome o ubiquinol oxidase operon protein cyoD